MKLRFITGIACLFMLPLQVLAQRTITNKDYRGRITEQYQVNVQGNRQGLYKNWNSQGRLIHESNWSNGVEHGRSIDYDTETGVIQRDAMMYKGQIISLKVYAYNDNHTIRSLIIDKTWTKDGHILTHREYNYATGTMDQYAGKLSNGRFWYDMAGYNEKYNANDTVYVWTNKDKEIFEGKYLNGIRVYTKEEAMNKKEQAIQDSISYSIELEEDERLDSIKEAKEQAMQDSIVHIKTKYQSLADSIVDTNTLYAKLLTDGEYSTEYTFYAFLCKYIKKTKDADLTLSNMIMNSLGISNVKDFDIKAVLVESDIISLRTTYKNDGITVTNKHNKSDTRKLKSYYYANSRFEPNQAWHITYTVPKDILANYNKQKELLDIILYCKEHNIVIK
ncbi:hypothetical protein [uncultured Dysgonomonas sp.]|uniref:hypothetical protein n=1 Tax=uncultured Dysgonomonas sp. TaxID=206096 RepID=UPI00262F5BD2|nr:hypothetical protein [uncultured Dysgonomonas sp.]